MVSLFKKIKQSILEISPGVPNVDMVEIPCACQENDGALEQWIELKAGENVQGAQAMDAKLVEK